MSEHGTNARMQQHRAAGETPCGPCLEAGRLYTAEWRATSKGKRRTRVIALAQGRARSRLVAMHPAEYRALYREEKAKAEREAGSERRIGARRQQVQQRRVQMRSLPGGLAGMQP